MESKFMYINKWCCDILLYILILFVVSFDAFYLYFVWSFEGLQSKINEVYISGSIVQSHNKSFFIILQ